MSTLYLTDEEKKTILEQRLRQFAAEKFQWEINLEVSAATDEPEGVDKANESIAILNTAIAVHEAKLAEITPAE